MEQKLCQSCAMPLTGADLLGTEKNGEKNEDYCKHCYVDGAFNSPNETMEEMIDTCVPFIGNEDGLDENEARKNLEAVLPTLKRWKN